jgi:transglutaminase-like putative cysteine protease
VQKLTHFTFTAPVYIERKIRYEVTSVISDTIYEEQIDENKYLQIPERMSQEITTLTKSLAKNKDKEKTAENLFRYLNSSQYQYSLRVSCYKNPSIISSASKYGNCECFASALSVMLRVADIPSNGWRYRGGYYNSGKYYLVPQKTPVMGRSTIPQRWMRWIQHRYQNTFALPGKEIYFKNEYFSMR